jgi:hypothetical protein
MQIRLVHTQESLQIRPECCPCSLAGVAVHLTEAISIRIPRPLVHAVAEGGMGWMAATIARPFIRIEPRAACWDICGDQVVAGLPVRVIAYPEAILARLSGHHTDDGRAIVGIGAVPFALMGTAAWRIARVTVGCAFFPAF